MYGDYPLYAYVKTMGKDFIIQLIWKLEELQQQLKNKKRELMFRKRKIEKIEDEENTDIQINVSRETLEKQIADIEVDIKYCKSAIRSLKRVINLNYDKIN